MAPIFCCGGECGFASSIAPHWIVNSGTPTFDTTTKRNGDRSIRFNVSASQASLRTVPLASSTRHVIKFYIRFTTLPSADITFCCQGTSTSGPNVRFKQSDSKIYAAVGTTLGASGVSVTTGVWYRIDADFNINTGGSDLCDVKVDGTSCGQATATGLSAAETTVTFGVAGASVTADVYIDDTEISVTGADYPLGSGYVNHFTVTADGTHSIPGANQFERGNTGTDITNATTDAYTLADNVPLPSSAEAADNIAAIAPANATDYVECLFGPAPGISAPTTGPRCVDVLVGYHQSGTQSGNIRVAINDNGTTNDVLNLTAAGVTTIRYARKAYSDPPSAASVWNANNDGSNGDFRDLRMRLFSSDAAPDQFLDAIMIEASFASTDNTTTDQTITAKSRIQKTVSATITAKSRIRNTVNKTITAISKISITTTKTITARSRIQKTVSATIPARSRIQKTVSQTIAARSRIQRTVSATIGVVSRIAKTVQRTIGAVSRITATVQRTIQSRSRITAISTQTIPARSRIVHVVNQTIPARSRIRTTSSHTIQSRSRIQKTVGQTITAITNIVHVINQTIPVRSRIRVIVTKTITALSRIQDTVDQTIQSRSRITVLTARTISARSSIRKTATQTIPAKSRIQRVVSVTITTLSRIQDTLDRTIVATSRIQKTVNRTITAVSKIQVVGTVEQSIFSKSRISVVALQTIPARSRISITSVKTIPSRSRISNLVVRTINSRSRIRHTVTQTITMVSLIRTTVSQSITTQSRIHGTVNQTITCRSKIFTTGPTTLPGPFGSQASMPNLDSQAVNVKLESQIIDNPDLLTDNGAVRLETE